jgi:lipoyl synthase
MPNCLPKPSWLRQKISAPGLNQAVRDTLDSQALHTVCQQARCPNKAECFGRGTATFLLLGPNCTRSCAFCAIAKKEVVPADPSEPGRVAKACSRMDLKFCVLTMVTRDDLPDGGAWHLARTVEAIHRTRPWAGVETLVSDFGGDHEALATVLAAEPEVLNHNMETVERLYPLVRPQAQYRRSLELLAKAARWVPGIMTKSGIMLGLGEGQEEVLRAMDDLRAADCLSLTLGQYLPPSPRHLPVVRYLTPQEFAEYESQARAKGFAAVASAPLVRSSYRAEQMYGAALESLRS